MSRYNQGYYYDPAGSQSQQLTGYTYQQPTATSTAAYPTASNSSNYQYSGNTYGSQQYATAVDQQANSSASHTAAALSSLSSANYTSTSSSRSGNPAQYDNSHWYTPSSTANNYNFGHLNLPNRRQSSNSPVYTQGQPVSTLGRLSVPEQSQASSNTFGASSSYQPASYSSGANSYQTACTQPQSQPPRYNSPLQAVQAQQQSHSKQSSWDSNHDPSPRLTNMAHAPQKNIDRQQSASVEPSPTTINPSQVYDNRAELQRKAQIDAEKRKKYEAEQAAKKAGEERVEAERRQAEEERRKVQMEAAKQAERVEREKQKRDKAKEEKKQSKSAASTLQRMVSSSGGDGTVSASPADKEEAEMRAMFQKMREFNAKNPAMLAKLWEEERRSHAQSQSPRAEKPSPAAAPKAPEQQPAPTALSPNQKSSVKPVNKAAEPPKVATPSPLPRANGTSATSGPPATQAATQQTTSLWPPHKKGHLADATATWLREQPHNIGKMVNMQTVLNTLDKNPSYVQLCEGLENLGLKFDRAALARELLRAVPDGLKAQPTAKHATPAESLTATTAASGNAHAANQASPTAPRPYSGTVNYEAPSSFSNSTSEVNSMGQSAYQSQRGTQPAQSPYFGHPRPDSSASRPRSRSQALEVKPEIKPVEPTRPPANKEEAARKRTFGDLVDLTAEDSEDEPTEPPSKKSMPSASASIDYINTMQVMPMGQPPPQSFKQFAYNTPNWKEQQSVLHAWHAHQPNGIPQAVQQPPSVPSQPQKPKGPTPEQQQQLRLKGKMLVEPIMRDRVARKSKYDSRTIARDVLLATGRHPDMRGLNAHLVNMQKLLAAHNGEVDTGGSRADLATVRWDIIDPEARKESTGESRPGTATTNGAVEGDGKLLGGRKPIATKQQKPREASVIPTRDSPTSNAAGVKARRGRPRKHKSPEPTTEAALTNGLGKKRQTSPRPTTPSVPALTNANDNNMSGSQPIGYTAFNQTTVNADGTVVKKKGRPFGWRKNVHSREAQGLTPVSAGGKPKACQSTIRTSKESRERHTEPEFQVFKCDWRGCRAELHNLDTLKQHIIKIHGPKDDDDDGRIECWWKGCGAETRHEGKVQSFDDIRDWLSHIEKEHLRPIAWKQGDGPRVRNMTFESAEPPSYLFDRYGRSVTPVIQLTPAKPSRMQTDLAESAESAASPPPPVVQTLGRGRPPKDGIRKAERDAGAPLKRLEEHQKAVGSIMDRMGCVLVDEGRRRAFLDDEDFEDEVYGSEFDVKGDD